MSRYSEAVQISSEGTVLAGLQKEEEELPCFII